MISRKEYRRLEIKKEIDERRNNKISKINNKAKDENEHIAFMERLLKETNIHLDKAIKRNPDTTEVAKLKLKISHYEFAIEAMKEKLGRN